LPNLLTPSHPSPQTLGISSANPKDPPFPRVDTPTLVIITTGTARVVLFSAVSVCVLFVCLSVLLSTRQLLNCYRYHHEIFKASSCGPWIIDNRFWVSLPVVEGRTSLKLKFLIKFFPNHTPTSPNRNFPVQGSFGEVSVMEFGLKGTARVCRGRHGEVGIVEFGLKPITACVSNT